MGALSGAGPLEAMRDGRRPEAGGKDGRRAPAFAALHESAATGRTVTPSPPTSDNPFWHPMNGVS